MSGGWNPVHGRDGSLGRAPTVIPMFPAAPPAYMQHHQQAAVNPPGLYNPHMPYHPWTVQPNGAQVPLARVPQAIPRIDSTMPAAQLTNSTGGVGCEPGYNYFFPPEHAKIHVLKCTNPPWQLAENAQVPFIATVVPTGVKLGELMRGFGCNNPTPKLNRVFEVVPGGNGRWYRGMCFSGDMKSQMGSTIGSIGWDISRTGEDGQKPAVYLWFTKG